MLFKHHLPTFIQIFYLNRLLDVDFVDDVKMFNKSDQQTALSILTNSIKYGIKKYMSDYFTESKHGNIIEQIFNKIILTKLACHYQQAVKYKSGTIDEKNNDYHPKVFNTSDLMHLIFQFVGSIFNCDLICSYWLCHSYNANSIYHINLSLVFNNGGDGIEKHIRYWQRVYKAKSAKIWLNRTMLKPNDFMLKQLSTLVYIEKLYCRIATDYGSVNSKNHKSILECIMNRFGNRISHFDCKILPMSCENIPRLPPLKLLNANQIHLHNAYFYAIWSNKCEQLYLHDCNDISSEWCKNVIDNCDCSGIKYLVFEFITFDKNIDSKILFPQLVKKFTNLQKLDIIRSNNNDKNLILFCKLLNSIINQNKGQISHEIKRIVGHYKVHIEEEKDKLDVLFELYRYETMKNMQSIVYCNSKHRVNWLTNRMRQHDFNYNVLSMHYGMAQQKRNQIMQQFLVSGMPRVHVLITNVPLVRVAI